MKNKITSKKDLIRIVLNLEKKLCRRPVKRDNNSLYLNSRNFFGSWNNFMKAAGYNVTFRQKVEVMNINDDFFYFLGLLITDGHIYHNPNKFSKVAIYTSYPDERNMILKLIKNLFNYNASFSSKMGGFNKKPNFEIRISSRNLSEFFIKNWKIPSGAKSLIIRIPQKIKRCKLSYKQSFVKGIIDGDGSITKRNIRIVSGCFLFIKDLKELLSTINIRCGSIIKERPTLFAINISRKSELLKMRSIYSKGLSYPRKRESINKI